MKDIPMTNFEDERQYEEASLLNEALEDVKEGRVLDGKEALLQLKEKYGDYLPKSMLQGSIWVNNPPYFSFYIL